MKKPPEGATTIGRFHRAEGDPARHKSRCFYYRKSDGWCSERVMTCPGSAYCSHYIEKDDAKFTFVEKCTSEKKEKTASTFQEIKFVDISLINVTPQAQTNKNEKKIRYFATIFNRTGRVEPPIKVSCSGTHYLVEDGNARYFAALGLGIKLIPVVFTERKISNFENRLVKGRKIKYGSYGEGKIIERKGNVIRVKFATFEAEIDVSVALQNQQLKLL